ncbi:MAG: hypothetical protein Kow0025_12740 [Thermodesulfovibrionales bacterium]
MPDSMGMVWFGFLFHRGGYGNALRNYLLGLKKIGFPVRAISHGPEHRDDLGEDLVSQMQELTRADVGRRAVGVVHYEPPIFERLSYRNITRRIGYTVFETDRLPSTWVRPCNTMDEIWVPSRFNVETFSMSGVRPDKLRIIPHSVDTGFFRPIGETFPIPGRRGFVFLYVSVFDWRKGFDLLAEAYFNEFTSRDDTTLVLKVAADRPDRGDLKRLILDIFGEKVDLGNPGAPHFVVMDEPITMSGLRRLYNTCDLYISTERANGWGMPCMEAMAMGKPAAAINWGGCTEFMTAENSALINTTGRMVPVDPRLVREKPSYEGHLWADVSVDEVRRVMRTAYENRDWLRRIAGKGREDVTGKFSLEVVAGKIAAAVAEQSPPTSVPFFGRPSINLKLRHRATVNPIKLLLRKAKGRD